MKRHTVHAVERVRPFQQVLFGRFGSKTEISSILTSKPKPNSHRTTQHAQSLPALSLPELESHTVNAAAVEVNPVTREAQWFISWNVILPALDLRVHLSLWTNTLGRIASITRYLGMDV